MRHFILLAFTLFFGLTLQPAAADAADNVIKIGNTGPYSGRLASYSRVLKAISSYFDVVNAKGGINGRTIKFISYDDAYDPNVTLEKIRTLVEEDDVLFTLFTMGTGTNVGVRAYMNMMQVPQLFAGSGAYHMNMPESFPWTNPGVPDYTAEATLYGEYLLKNHPDAKVAILYQDDDYGRLYFGAFLKSLGAKARDMIVSYQAYSPKEDTVAENMKVLKESGANTFFNVSTPRFSVQAINAMNDLNWKPLHIMALPVTARNSVLDVVGLDKVQGALTAQITKDPADPSWADDKAVMEYKQFMKEHAPEVNPNDNFVVAGYLAAKLAEELLKKCGDDISRENIIKVRNSFSYEGGMLLPGVKIDLSADDLSLVKTMKMVEFKGQSWKLLGD